ncbi:MAG: HNH endonuclease [Chloroflexi bacterium]|nr:HNH endonuclease [Chloroflexota bacterium]
MPEQRARVAERAKGSCEYCHSQERYSPDSFSIEHIIPRIKGGKNTLDNLAFACQGCNNRKFTSTEAFDPVSQTTTLLFNPRQHQWAEHFAWSNEGTLYCARLQIAVFCRPFRGDKSPAQYMQVH